MVTKSRLRRAHRVLPRLAGFAIWALAAGCGVYWGLRATQPAPAPLPTAVRSTVYTPDGMAVARVLGAQSTASAAPAVTPGRYQLLGVVRRGQGLAGAAVIAVDGRPPRVVLVGQPVGERSAGVTLSALGVRSATLTPREGDPIELTMPPLRSPYAAGPAPAPATAPLGPEAAPNVSPSLGSTASAAQPLRPARGTLKPSFIPASPGL